MFASQSVESDAQVPMFLCLVASENSSGLVFLNFIAVPTRLSLGKTPYGSAGGAPVPGASVLGVSAGGPRGGRRGIPRREPNARPDRVEEELGVAVVNF